MTTYEFRSGLRLAVMKLVNSLPSNGGSLPNPIVDLHHAEERMAARLITRLGVAPPIDVEEICRSLASLAFKEFPVEIDGICLDLKVPGKQPKVWVAKQMPYVRKRFTLAHEIGHIVIPWHTGTIIDDIDATRSLERGRYREMEAEANRFAAELLMPSSWVIGLAERCEHAAGLMHSIQTVAEVSQHAAFLKTVKFGKPGFVGAQVKNGVVIRSDRTPETKSRSIEFGTTINNVEMRAAFDPVIIQGHDLSYYWWQIRDTLPDPGGNQIDWRELLENMLDDIPPEYRKKTRASINSIIGLAIGREPRGGSLERMLRRGVEATQNRSTDSAWVIEMMKHPRFEEYIIARARERALLASGAI